MHDGRAECHRIGTSYRRQLSVEVVSGTETCGKEFSVGDDEYAVRHSRCVEGCEAGKSVKRRAGRIRRLGLEFIMLADDVRSGREFPNFRFYLPTQEALPSRRSRDLDRLPVQGRGGPVHIDPSGLPIPAAWIVGGHR